MNPKNNTNRRPAVNSVNPEEKAIDLKSRHVLERKRNWGLVLLAAVMVVILLLSSCGQDNSTTVQTTASEADATTGLPTDETSIPTASESGEPSATSEKPTAETTEEETVADNSINELITPEDAKDLLESDSEVLLLDVRTESEYIDLRIPGSLLLPVGELESRIDEIAEWKEKTVIVYCRSGNRSSQAADILQKNGFMTIYDLGGIYDWPFDTESGSD